MRVDSGWDCCGMLVLLATSSTTTAYSLILFCGESPSSQVLTKGIDDNDERGKVDSIVNSELFCDNIVCYLVVLNWK